MASRILRIQYDSSVPWGAKEHYFHALHGYLLPGLHHALMHHYDGIQFEDCGPLIQPRLSEGCQLAGLAYVDTDESVRADTYRLPRWDRLLLHFEAPPPPNSVIDAYRQTVTPLLNRLRSAAKETWGDFPTQFQQDMIAVIRRSDDHPFYHSDRMAAFPAYGTGRSELINASDVARTLQSEGLAAQVVEFGAMSLGEQILTASRASAILGIRGAEFANVIWMRPHTRAVMLAPPGRENYATRTLSRIVQVNFFHLPVGARKVSLDQKGQVAVADILKGRDTLNPRYDSGMG